MLILGWKGLGLLGSPLFFCVCHKLNGKMDPNLINLILEVLRALEMDPHGVFTGLAGSVLSLFVLNGNSFTWKKTGLIIVAGVCICGYSMPWIEQIVITSGKTRSPAHLLNLGVGFISSDLLSSIKTAAPTLTNTLIKLASKILSNFVGVAPPTNQPPKT